MIPQKGFEVSIRASATLPDGQPVSTSTKYRIKDIPAPSAIIFSLVGQLERSNLMLKIQM